MRDRAIILLIACLGLKVEECADLDLESVMREGADYYLLINGCRPRVLRLGDFCIAVILRWLDQRAHMQTAGNKALFITRTGARLSSHRMYAMIRGAGIRTGTKITARRLRRAALVNMATLEISDRLLAQQTGAMPVTIKRYRAAR